VAVPENVFLPIGGLNESSSRTVFSENVLLPDCGSPERSSKNEERRNGGGGATGSKFANFGLVASQLEDPSEAY
jgi:hypothetical protein